GRLVVEGEARIHETGDSGRQLSDALSVRRALHCSECVDEGGKGVGIEDPEVVSFEVQSVGQETFDGSGARLSRKIEASFLDEARPKQRILARLVPETGSTLGTRQKPHALSDGAQGFEQTRS